MPDRLPPVPHGPARQRASDADRELLAQALQVHYESGRLDQEDLETRLAATYAAKRYGELARLVEDLPQPEQPQPKGSTKVVARRAQRKARGPFARLVRGILITGVSTFGVLLVIGIVVNATEDHPGSSSGSYDPPEPKVTRVAAGGTGEDAGIRFEIAGAPELVRQIRQDPDRGDALLDAGPQRRFAIVPVLETNTGRKAVDGSFCGSYGAELHDANFDSYTPIDQLYQYEGNTGKICRGDALPAGDTIRVRLVFSVPADVDVEALDLWNNDEDDDSLGKTRLRFPIAASD